MTNELNESRAIKSNQEQSRAIKSNQERFFKMMTYTTNTVAIGVGLSVLVAKALKKPDDQVFKLVKGVAFREALVGILAFAISEDSDSGYWPSYYYALTFFGFGEILLGKLLESLTPTASPQGSQP